MISRVCSSSAAGVRSRLAAPPSTSGRRHVAAAAAPITVVAKGDPDNQVLGDCPFCHKVLLTLAQKGIEFDYEFVDFARKPQWVVDVSGGKVPIIKVPGDGNLVLPDSDAIVEYLEEKYPQPSMAADPGLPEGLIDKVFPSFRAWLNDPTAEHRTVMVSELKKVDAYLSGRGPLFGGAAMDATDAAFAPRLYHITVMLLNKGSMLPEELTALWRYLGHIQTLPAWQQVDYGAAKIVQGWSTPH